MLRREPQVEKTAWRRLDTLFIGEDENYVEDEYCQENGIESYDDGDGCWVADVCYLDEEPIGRWCRKISWTSRFFWKRRILRPFWSTKGEL